MKNNLDLKSTKTKIKGLRSIYHTEEKKVKGDSLIVVVWGGGEGEAVCKLSFAWFHYMHALLIDVVEDWSELVDEEELIL